MAKKNMKEAIVAPLTIKSVCDAVKEKLCEMPVQDFWAAALVRDVQRVVDPLGKKRLTRSQARVVRAFLKVVTAVAYK